MSGLLVLFEKNKVGRPSYLPLRHIVKVNKPEETLNFFSLVMQILRGKINFLFVKVDWSASCISMSYQRGEVIQFSIPYVFDTIR